MLKSQYIDYQQNLKSKNRQNLINKTAGRLFTLIVETIK